MLILIFVRIFMFGIFLHLLLLFILLKILSMVFLLNFIVGIVSHLQLSLVEDLLQGHLLIVIGVTDTLSDQ